MVFDHDDVQPILKFELGGRPHVQFRCPGSGALLIELCQSLVGDEQQAEQCGCREGFVMRS